MIQVEKCSMRGKDVGKAMWQDMTTEQNYNHSSRRAKFPSG